MDYSVKSPLLATWGKHYLYVSSFFAEIRKSTEGKKGFYNCNWKRTVKAKDAICLIFSKNNVMKQSFSRWLSVLGKGKKSG